MTNTQKRILVVDDDDMLRETHVMVFEDEGYQVDSAINGQEAWDLINKNHYDLVTTDLFMPIMNGIEFILKCQEDFPSLKIVLVSGGGSDVEAEHGQDFIKFMGKRVNVDIFLKKPFSLIEMLSIVEKLLQE
ncbi:MAG: response regulator [Gammaproteobacteria bacterium]|nr:response regulator [Gammaproteobacteria bacterium]